MKMKHEHQSVSQLLQVASSLAATSTSPHLDCQLILAFCLGRTREWLIANSDEHICANNARDFKTLISRRQKGEPVAYIIGRKEFWDSTLSITRDTLIPRPETELLVETILDTFDKAPRLVVDLGTGSGAIAISLALERPSWHILGVDSNRRALAVAKTNGAGITNLDWLEGNWGNALNPGSIDLMVCNPPYIAENDPCLDGLVFEPQSALVSADNGLADIYSVILEAQRLLKPEGHLLLEHGYNQQEQVCNRLMACEFHPTPLLDLQGNPRAVLGKRVNKRTTDSADER